jgi:predicted amidohydrolase
MKILAPFLGAAMALPFTALAASQMKPTEGQERQVKIGIAQILCLDVDRAGNLARIENAILEAKLQGAEIVTFPESSLLGWENPAAHVRSHSIPGEDSDRLCALARKHRVFLSVGLDEKDGEGLYDSCLLIDDAGNILLKHRKVNVLPELMSPPYSVGDGAARTADTKFGRIGMMICADSFLKELVQRMADQRPDLVLIPYGWAAPEGEWPNHGDSLRDIVQTVARTVHCPVIGTDLVGAITNGPWSGQVYGGQSVAADGDGSILFRGRDRDRDVTVLSVRVRAPVRTR